MCMPLELRFVGTVLENLGKKDYHYLREWEIKANNPAEVSKYKDLPAEYLRAKLMISLTLLHSSNTACAQVIFDAIESNSEAFGPSDDNKTTEDVLMILTLAINHPAFLFEQHQRLNALLAHLDTRKREPFRDNHSDEEASLDLCQEAAYPSEEHFPIPTGLCIRHSPAAPQPRKVCISNIDVKSTRKSAEKKGGPEYVIQATWSNGDVTEVYKKYREISELHQKLNHQFPEETSKKHNGKIPPFPPGIQQCSSQEEYFSEQIRSLNGYFKSLLGVPAQILECDHIVSFFRGIVINPRLPSLSISMPCQPLPDARIPRWPLQQHLYAFRSGPFPFMPSQSCPYQSPAHSHSLQQPSPTSSPRSPTSSVTSSPNNSQPASPSPQGMNPDTLTSVTQLLKLLSLEKFDDTLRGYSVEQLSCMTSEELGNLGLPREAQETLRSKLDVINSDKPGPINGLIDNMYPSAISASSAAASLPWHSAASGVGYLHHHQGLPSASRAIFSAPDSSLGLAYVPSPPASPVQAFTSLQGKLQAGDSSEGSEDIDREKSDSVPDRGVLQHSKPAQIMVPAGSGGGGAGSPRPISASSNLQMTPLDDSNKITLVPAPLPLLPLIPHPTHLSTPNPAPGLLGQYVDPKTDINLIGMAANAHGNTSNNNNNGYSSDSGPITSTGAPQRQSLLHASIGVRGHYKAGQPQPAHTNVTGMLQGKNLMSMPADTHTAKPNSPVIQHIVQPYMGLRPPEIPPHLAQGLSSGAAPSAELGAPRVSLYIPYGRGQGGHMTSTIPGHQGVLPHPSLVTRAGQTTLVASVASMTVSASHPVTAVTASHGSVLTVTTTASHRSPSHSSGNSGQRESSTEAGAISNSIGSNDTSLRSSPSSGTGVGSASSPPSFQQVGCSLCEQRYMGQVPAYPYQYLFQQAPNGIIPPHGISSYSFAQSQHLGSGIYANGFTPEVYNYNALGYSSIPTSHFHPVFYGSNMFPGMQPQQNLTTPAAGGSTGVVPQTLTPVGVTTVPLAQAQASGLSGKHRSVGCYNCGSLQHGAAACQENSMENMSGHYHLNYKVPPPRSDSD
ncbi:hypothetical protein C0Q70_18712 [Pomacea canaliculata]|uniref:PX domain-containing protein n=2 Tax=Pomacea canaliculata TaxID=400727 RepID=A0A2T7NHC8_POMCA|nr:hypothetical protein C0Q70_18712 [Pomacea canaliculata]